jgi:myo-inositol-1(or 4)-monophosphatase
MVQEAGGIVSDFDNRQDFLDSGNIVCGSPRVHEELISIIQRHTSNT